MSSSSEWSMNQQATIFYRHDLNLNSVLKTDWSLSVTLAFCLNQTFPARVEAQSMIYSRTKKPTLINGKFGNLTPKNEENSNTIAELGKTISISNSKNKPGAQRCWTFQDEATFFDQCIHLINYNNMIESVESITLHGLFVHNQYSKTKNL